MPSRDHYINPLFSEGVNRIIAALDPAGRPQGSVVFPLRQGWDQSLRVGGGESIQAWFRRIVGGEDEAQSRIEQCAVNDQLAFFGRVNWNAEGISLCRLQALVTTGGSLVDLYLGAPDSTPEANYYRLDFDLAEPGPLFKEALPHVHCAPDGPPRFPFACAGEYLPVAFLEFIHLNHFNNEWLRWARVEVYRHGGELPFERIIESFGTGRISGELAMLRPHLAALKGLLSSAKRRRIANPPRLHADVADLNYHPSTA